VWPVLIESSRPRFITLQTLSAPTLLWTLTPTSMILTSLQPSTSLPQTPIASFHPNARLTPTGTFEQKAPSKSGSIKRRADERDWLEIGLLPASLPISELLGESSLLFPVVTFLKLDLAVEFLLLNNIRQLYFLLPPEPPSSPISPTPSVLSTGGVGESLQKRIRQAVF
jgi:hypothetical protein